MNVYGVGNQEIRLAFLHDIDDMRNSSLQLLNSQKTLSSCERNMLLYVSTISPILTKIRNRRYF